jgi:hypothetical protein
MVLIAHHLGTLYNKNNDDDDDDNDRQWSESQ